MFLLRQFVTDCDKLNGEKKNILALSVKYLKNETYRKSLEFQISVLERFEK